MLWETIKYMVYIGRTGSVTMERDRGSVCVCVCVCARLWSRLVLRSCGSLGPVGDGSRLAAVVISLTFTSGQAGREDRHTNTFQPQAQQLNNASFHQTCNANS